MAAAAFKVSLNVRNANGQSRSLYLTASDVNAAALVFPSGGTEMQLSSVPSVISDLICAPTYGTDTTNMTLYVNGVDSGIRIINAANQSGTINRQILTNPVMIPAGALVKFVQNT
jgi:hypothetical protein